MSRGLQCPIGLGIRPPSSIPPHPLHPNKTVTSEFTMRPSTLVKWTSPLVPREW